MFLFVSKQSWRSTTCWSTRQPAWESDCFCWSHRDRLQGIYFVIELSCFCRNSCLDLSVTQPCRAFEKKEVLYDSGDFFVRCKNFATYWNILAHSCFMITGSFKNFLCIFVQWPSGALSSDLQTRRLFAFRSTGDSADQVRAGRKVLPV